MKTGHKLSVDIFDIAGAHIAKTLDRRMDAGHYELYPTAYLKSPPSYSVYVIRLKSGRDTHLFKMLHTKSDFHNTGVRKISGLSDRVFAKTRAVLDTLRVNCTGYLEEQKEVTDYQVNLGNIKVKRIPNILLVYVDDLGYGDAGFLNADSKIPTPNLDKLASESISFTDAHTPYGICGPSRYGLLTGRYSWRKPGGTGNGGTFDNVKISPDRLTLASMFKTLGYNTAQMGKWGLRHNYTDALKDGMTLNNVSPVSFDFENKKLLGANTIGFDYAWTLVHLSSNKNTKYAFENGSPAVSISQIYDAHNCLPDGTENAIEYLKVYAGVKNDTRFLIDRQKPFFLYWDPHVPHEPIVPNDEFKGKTNAGDYGDFVYEFDFRLGQILKTLDTLEMAENTVVLFASDNGPENTCYNRVTNHDHYSMGALRGVKRDLWEGGTRTPFLVRWPGIIPANTEYHKPIGLASMLATFAALHSNPLPHDMGEDSYNILPAILGETDSLPEMPIIYGKGSKYALRRGDWVYIDGDHESFASEPQWFRDERGVISDNLSVELYNLKDDPQELNNLAGSETARISAMAAELDDLRQSGRSRP
jgi:arylsulfatase A